MRIGMLGKAVMCIAAGTSSWGARERLNVVIFDYAETPGETLNKAVVITRGLFRAAGVETDWTVCRMAKDHKTTCEIPLTGTWLKSVVLAEADRHAREAMGKALVTRTGEPVVSYVFFDRAVALAKHTGQPIHLVVACVLAHEIGHLMGLRHTSSGVMQADLGQREIFEAAQDRLQFTAQDAQRLRDFGGSRPGGADAAGR
ncbi:MAG TPA: hypothetical protein VML19_26975 [Verrucomicrobiae bacterium]|nr:hypothetical protein [Verrucomicrobiae bacterium]